MKFMGRSMLALYAFVAISGSTYASIFTFGELLLKPVSIKSKIVKEGVSGGSITSLKDSIHNSVASLSHGHVSLSDGLAAVKADATKEDAAKIGRIQAALKMNHDSVTGQEFKDIVNDLAYIASVYGEDSSKLLNCSYCKSDQLATLGFKSNITVIADPSLKRLVSRLPKSSTAISRYISKMSRKGNAKDISRYLDSGDRKTLALFFSFNDRGAKKEYKQFYEAVAKYNSDKSGNVTFAGPTAKATFWKIIDGKFSPQRAAKLAKAINEAAKKPVSKREDEFYKQLYKISDKTPETANSIEELKAKKCFFK